MTHDHKPEPVEEDAPVTEDEGGGPAIPPDPPQ